GLVITPAAADAGLVNGYQITSITGGTLFLNNGTTQVTDGEVITAAQGAAGLKFTANSLVNGSFTVQESSTIDTTGLSGTTTAATITVTSPLPSYPDLQVSNLRLSATLAQPGQVITIFWNDINAGDGPTPTGVGWQDGIAVDNLTTGQTLVDTTVGYNASTSGAIAADGQSPQLSISFALPGGSQGAGLLVIAVDTNFNDTLFESNANGTADSNNTATIQVISTIPVSAPFGAPTVTNAFTDANTQTTAGLVITANAADAALVNGFQITNIAGGSLFLNDGATPIVDGQVITVAQGAAGLKFTPTANSFANGGFTVRESATVDASGISGAAATATINVRIPYAVIQFFDPIQMPGDPASGGTLDSTTNGGTTNGGSPNGGSMVGGAASGFVSAVVADDEAAAAGAQSGNKSVGIPMVAPLVAALLPTVRQNSVAGGGNALGEVGRPQYSSLAMGSLSSSSEERMRSGGGPILEGLAPDVVMVQFQALVPEVQIAELSDARPDPPDLPSLLVRPAEGLTLPEAPQPDAAISPLKSWRTVIFSGIAIVGSLLLAGSAFVRRKVASRERKTGK
ncbi:MAG TPA: hypothetical protein VHX65_08930, partial [Pirellulales bacterium]|nr:hypothetical protein [Pirellulales bacterium]